MSEKTRPQTPLSLRKGDGVVSHGADRSQRMTLASTLTPKRQAASPLYFFGAAVPLGLRKYLKNSLFESSTITSPWVRKVAR